LRERQQIVQNQYRKVNIPLKQFGSHKGCFRTSKNPNTASGGWIFEIRKQRTTLKSQSFVFDWSMVDRRWWVGWWFLRALLGALGGVEWGVWQKRTLISKEPPWNLRRRKEEKIKTKQ